MKRTFLFILSIICFYSVISQSLTLDKCQELAYENYPVITQRGLIDKSAEFTISNAKRYWLPQISIMAQATYQSDIMTIPEDFDNFLQMAGINLEGLPKDQYKAAIQIEQIIWGGGAVRSQVEIAKAESEAAQQSWEIEMYSLRERINQLFFGTLLLQEKTKEADILIEELNRNYRVIESYKENGIAGQNDLDQIEVEILSANQQKSELVSTQKAYRIMLSLMTNTEISENIELIKPDFTDIPLKSSNNRPELKYFDAQERILDARSSLINSSIKPQIGAFFQGVYSNPGLNLLEDMQKNQWSPYFITGIKFQWNISGFYSRKNNISQIDLNRLQLNSQRETFLYNINLKRTQEEIAINRMREVLTEDDKIIELRNIIRKRTEAQIENGTKTVSDLLRDIHSENLSRQNKITHEIELIKNIYDLKNTINN